MERHFCHVEVGSLTRLGMALALAMACGACGPPERNRDLAPVEETQTEVPPAPVPTELNIGDVEQQIDIEAALAPESSSGHIKEDPVIEKSGRIKILTITMSPPHPQKLLIRYTINSRQAWDTRPVVLRGRLLVDREREIASLATVLGADAQRNSFELVVDVLQGLDRVPETLGVTFSGEALLMPRDTDVATIDPKTAESSERSGALYATVVRVNFASPAAQETGQ